MKMWNAETGQDVPPTKRQHLGYGHCVAFSPDSRRIVCGSLGGTLKLWDAETGQETLTLKGHLRDIRTVAFSPDGRRIVSGGRGGTLKVWDASRVAGTP